MTAYILSILGIVILGILIDVIVPSGSINKYIKSIFSIFVVAVIIFPIINVLSNISNININYDQYESNQQLLNYISSIKIEEMQKSMVKELKMGGFDQTDIELQYSTNGYELSINSCIVNIKNLVIDKEHQHINKYEFIIEVVQAYTNLEKTEIIFYE